NSVRSLLGVLGYSLQANRKTREGTNHPDRDAQFGYINDQVKAALAADEPAISVDTKKKELVGDFKNAGREWCPKGEPEEPPGTSKWNKIEHRLFSFITQNWRGKPLVSHQVIVQLIAATATKTGLKVRSEIAPNSYPAGIKIAAADLARVNLQCHEFHGDW